MTERWWVAVPIVCLASMSCSSGTSTGSSAPVTMPFPTADDRWDGEVGTVGNVVGTRTPPSASRADFVLRAAEPVACEQKLGVAVGSSGSAQVDARPIVFAEGATEVTFSRDTSAFSGRAIDLQLFGTAGSCGPLKVSVTESTVTFIP